ncbi:HTH-type transcriptional activator RhaR [Methylobacterium dankookense]|uniref:HTH-type transcriptional activator RhaR n=1 Tax=Methylobacterium dankookense TaxID=560405 RepID=A0A564FZW1_9HYPH|nr:HTH-type transcriptional activator RhaS [Methylobacterium dankookense]VUF13230.1 HTH-type transcriptional activator RhaR [Methylobacterium dankookense]
MARELAISPRQVHVLFEPTGSSMARTLTALRVAEAHRLLTTAPALSVTEIAFACGFDSIATFYRAFHRAHGMTPGDARSVLRDGPPRVRKACGAPGPA